MTPGGDGTGVRVRDLREGDRGELIRIDALHTGASKPDYWERTLGNVLRAAGRDPVRVGLAADGPQGLIGYLIGEVRAFEFGSDACGWVHAIGVDPQYLRGGVATRLLAEACRRFRDAGVRRVRTMVRRNDVPVLSFFRANGFVGGSFVQLELDLEEAR
ncbi:MAG: GNAT family N-acetyltransferase [Acidobacteriota bacterium]